MLTSNRKFVWSLYHSHGPPAGSILLSVSFLSRFVRKLATCRPLESDYRELFWSVKTHPMDLLDILKNLVANHSVQHQLHSFRMGLLVHVRSLALSIVDIPHQPT